MPVGYATTNYPNGVTNAATGSTLQTYVVPDPTTLHTFFDDFNSYSAAQWTNTKTSTATQAIVNGDGGILAMVNSAANADLNANQLVNSNFVFTPGKALWFKTRFSVSSALNSAFVIGLQNITTTPLTATDGVYFNKAAASTAVSLISRKTSVSSTLAVGAVADATYVTMGFHYDGNALVQAYLNDVRVGSVPVTNLPTATLTISYAVSNGTAAANTMNVDYLLASSER